MPAPRQHLSEKELLRLYATDRNPEWLGIALERYTILLVGICMKYLKEQEEARDIVQQVFIKALHTLEKQQIDNLGGWLYRVAKNECLDYLRKLTYNRNIEEEQHYLQAEDTDLSAYLERDITIEALHKAIGELKQDQKICIELFYLQQKSYQEIAEITKFEIRQVKSNIQNGKRNLKIKLEEQQLGK